MATTLNDGELRRVYHHTFLPPQLPQASDDKTNVDIHLINLTLEALRAYKQLLPQESPSSLDGAIAAIKNLKSINSLEYGATSESELHRVLSGFLMARAHLCAFLSRTRPCSSLASKTS